MRSVGMFSGVGAHLAACRSTDWVLVMQHEKFQVRPQLTAVELELCILLYHNKDIHLEFNIFKSEFQALRNH